MAQTLGLYHGRFTINSANDSFSLNGNALTVTNRTTYFVAGYTSEATNQLVEEVQTQCRTVHATANVDYNATSGLVTFTFPSASNIAWTDTDLRDLLGFTASDDVTSETSMVGSNPARYQWRPTRGLANYPTNLDASEFWNPNSTSVLVRSRDGTAYGLQGTLYYDAPELQYRMLPEADVIIPSTGTVYRSFQQFWLDVVHAAEHVRFYPDRDSLASDDYVTGLIGDPEDEAIGSWAGFSRRHVRAYNGLWDVSFPMIKAV